MKGFSDIFTMNYDYSHLTHIQSHDELKLYELIPDVVWIFDLDKHGWWWGNSAALSRSGWTRAPPRHHRLYQRGGAARRDAREPPAGGSNALYHGIVDVAQMPIMLTLVGQPDVQVSVGAGIGIALYPDHAEDLEGLIKAADHSMYEVKKAGKNGYAFAPDA